jgi:predicted DNA repair protein MutK
MVTTRAGSRGWRQCVAAVICLASIGAGGCAETIQKTAKSAAPAAVEGAAEEAQQPDTRRDIATVLSDPEIRSASSSLSAAILAGALDGLTDEERTQQLRRLTDAMVRTMGASMARSMRDDIGPQLSKSLADAVNQSLEQALDADMERRLEAMTLAITRGMLKGAGEALVDPSGQPSPVWGHLLGRIARDATHEAAFGLDDAVRRAEQNDGGEPPAPVLAALGTVATLTRALPFLIAGGLLLSLLLGAVPVAWLIVRLRHHKRQSLAHEEAALALARAIKAAEPLAWSNELRDHLARETKDAAGAAELARLLREHAELRLNPRERPPRSERSGYVG